MAEVDDLRDDAVGADVGTHHVTGVLIDNLETGWSVAVAIAFAGKDEILVNEFWKPVHEDHHARFLVSERGLKHSASGFGGPATSTANKSEFSGVGGRFFEAWLFRTKSLSRWLSDCVENEVKSWSLWHWKLNY